jgi:hypothetical protein
MKKLTAILLTAGLVLVLTATAPAVVPTADTYIRGAANGDLNHGTATSVVVKNNNGGANDRKIYIRYEIAGGASEASIEFTVTTNNEGGGGTTPQTFTVEVFGLAESLDHTWVENEITWNNAPANNTSNHDFTEDATMLGSFVVDQLPAGATVTFSDPNLADFINSDSDNQITLLLRRTTGNGSHNLAFASKENTSYPPPILTMKIATQASDPNPAMNAADVPRDVVLNWAPGKFAVAHDVYVGTAFADVNAATVPTAAGLDVNSFDPGRLQLEQTYFWRVDEVNAPPDRTVFKGSVWNFTVEPVSYPLPIGAVTASASSSDPVSDPGNTVNGSGLNDNDQHSSEMQDMWLGATDDLTPWIQFALPQVHKLEKVHLWNHNSQTETVLGFGIREALIETSTDGEAWSELGTVELAQASGTGNYTGMDLPLGGVLARYVRITGLSNYSTLGLPQMGLAEVRFYTIPVKAREPEPADGSTSNGVDVTLRWRNGREAVEHEVVFSVDEQSVIDGSAVVGTASESSYDLGTLDLGMTYFWKINEMNDLGTPPVHEGDLWTFLTPEHLMIDDFERYRAEEGLRIWEHWFDGFDDPGSNGAVVGNGDDAEMSVVYEGSQSMPIAFDNTTAPQSEVTRFFDTPVDLTRGNPESLKLQIRGDAPGFVENADGTLTVGAAGADIWNTADDFRFVYKRLSGDGSITARIDSCTQANVWTKAGIMMRENLSAEATNAYSFVTPTGRVGTQWRVDTFGATVSTRSETEGEITLPIWVRLTRKGNLFKGEQSADGATWQPMFQSGTPDLPTEREIFMIPDIYIGLAVTSHQTGVPATAMLSNVSTTGSVTGSWTAEAIGADTHPDNDAAPMYLIVADTAGKEKRIDHPSPAATVLTDWDAWAIPLADLSPVNTTRIDSITVGVGSSGVRGRVFVDAIRTETPYPDTAD